MLRGAIIGFGRMGLTHFSILAQQPKVDLVAVCDSSSFMLKNAAKYMNVDTFSDPETMLAERDLDFVVISTPTATHADAVTMAIDKGLHVFVEKPFALNAEQGHAVLRRLQTGPVVNQVGYVLRFSDVFIEVRKLLDAGVIGEVLSFKMEMYGPTVLHGAKGSWRSKKSEGGGCLYDFASHAVDMVNYLIGEPDEVTGTVFQSIYSVGIEDAVTSTFLYKSGVQGSFHVNWSDPSYRKPTYRFEAFGRNGKIIADLHAYRLFLRSKVDHDGFTEGWNQRYVTDFFQPVQFYLRGFEFTRQLDHFVDCMLHGRTSPISSFEQGYQTDVVIERLRQDAERRAV